PSSRRTRAQQLGRVTSSTEGPVGVTAARARPQRGQHLRRHHWSVDEFWHCALVRRISKPVLPETLPAWKLPAPRSATSSAPPPPPHRSGRCELLLPHSAITPPAHWASGPR